VIAATATAAGLLGAMAGFSASGPSVIRPVLAVGLLMGIRWFYRHRRRDDRIAVAVTGVAQLITFTAVGAALSYILASGTGPLWDSTFMAWDRALGLDWSAYLAFVDARPTLGWWLGIAYQSITPQLIVAGSLLALSGRIEASRSFVAAFVVCALLVILISGATPALSIIPHLGLGPADYPNLTPAAAYGHVSDVLGLRNGTLRTLTLDRMEGIIAFPSLHAGLALVLATAFWSMRWLRWPGLVLNAAMLAATPIHGSHYFVDVFAGLAVAAASLALVSLAARRPVTRTDRSARQAYLAAPP
jgi:hypothetical protein